jgi:hypothetical protein
LPKLNEFGISEKIKYRTADVCSILGISPDVLRWRSLHGKYPEVTRDGRGRVYTLRDIQRMIANPPNVEQTTVTGR